MRARDLIPFLDLTLLDPTAHASDVQELCTSAWTPFGPVKALCLYAENYRSAQIPKGVLKATVVKFSHGCF